MVWGWGGACPDPLGGSLTACRVRRRGGRLEGTFRGVRARLQEAAQPSWQHASRRYMPMNAYIGHEGVAQQAGTEKATLL